MDAGMLEIARRFQPDAALRDLAVVGEGQLCVAVRVGGIVLRFPRSDFARDRLRDEIRILSQIRPRLEHTLPDIVDADLDAPTPRAFIAHWHLEGSVLTRDVVDELGRAKVARIATATASFLRDLHSLRIPDLPELTNQQLAASLMDEATRLLRPRMAAERWGRVESELRTLEGVATDHLALCHTDIGGNVLYDAASERVSFIDFGSAMTADPLLDVASLSVLGSRFLALCAETYPLIGERSDAVQAVRATFHLQDALYGARQGDWTYVDDVLATY